MKLEKELEVLKRKAQHHNAMEKRYKLLEEDYRNLLISYERSENIRKKQKVIIEKLKEDIENVETHKPTSKQRKNRYKY
ncbi:MAG: hypothetical protein V2I33_24725 [Kangiellaceae bacterium]|jgi:hypothetical protein|nr:hypothetical protein [Kangiellaceae bacterium]